MSNATQDIERALRALRLSGIIKTYQARAMQAANGTMDHLEFLMAVLTDELDRRQATQLDLRFKQSGLPERKSIESLDWSYNPKLPKRQILELATLKFIDAHEDALLLGPAGLAKSHVAKALGLLAIKHGYKVIYREARDLCEEIFEARQLQTFPKLRDQLCKADALIIDDLFLRRMPAGAVEEIVDILMSRYEKRSTIVTSNRPIEDWAAQFGDAVATGPILDRLMHHGHMLKFEGKSWRLKESAERAARGRGGE